MIIEKYSKRKQRSTIVTESVVNNVIDQAEAAVVQKAQETAASTATGITATATVNSDGYLIMTTDVAQLAPQQEVEANG